MHQNQIRSRGRLSLLCVRVQCSGRIYIRPLHCTRTLWKRCPREREKKEQHNNTKLQKPPSGAPAHQRTNLPPKQLNRALHSTHHPRPSAPFAMWNTERLQDQLHLPRRHQPLLREAACGFERRLQFWGMLDPAPQSVARAFWGHVREVHHGQFFEAHGAKGKLVFHGWVKEGADRKCQILPAPWI